MGFMGIDRFYRNPRPFSYSLPDLLLLPARTAKNKTIHCFFQGMDGRTAAHDRLSVNSEGQGKF